jgi:hypothetical protein
MVHTTDVGAQSSVRVLITEDDRDTAESRARLLRIFGYEVQVAREGGEAIARELGWSPRHSDIRAIVRTAWEWHRVTPGAIPPQDMRRRGP